jgi:hypothetical protein
VDDADQQAGKHQPHGDLGIDPRPALLMAIAFGDLRPQPCQVENAIDAGQHMIVRNELPQRTGDEQLELISFLVPQHGVA